MYDAITIKKILEEKRRKVQYNYIAHKLGVTSAYISMLLNGKRNNPDMLKKIKEILNEQ